ncbi:MAG: hypothetical protein JSS31_06075 [Proteobacteria bacterium]|nr:hypothetical protein [Pseudomonadota bacterium]MBS0493520.1 hypothetical protein [Pseudomonadota bacterium]
MPSELEQPPFALPGGRFEGRGAFQQLVRDALACAAQEGWRELILCDADFHDWPLGERAVAESLQQWARSGRRLTLLAADYGELQRRHARFVQWRVRWDHIIQCRRAGAADPQDLPSAIWSPQWVLQRHDPLRCSGVTGTEPERRVLLREAIDEWLDRKSTPGFSASILGL